MATPFRSGRGVVGIKAESTPGTFNVPGATDSFHATNITFTPSQQMWERKDSTANFGLRDSIPGSAEGDISFEVAMTGVSAFHATQIAEFPFWDQAFMACGHQRVATPSATVGSIVYSPTTFFRNTVTGTAPAALTASPAGGYSVSMWTDDQGLLSSPKAWQFSITGAQGEVSISTKQGEPLIAKFKFHGAYYPATMATQVTATGDPTLNPPTFLGAKMTLLNIASDAAGAQGSWAFDGWEFTKGNVLSKRGDVSAAAGVRGAWITGHKPMIKLAPEMVNQLQPFDGSGGLDLYDRWRKGTVTTSNSFIGNLTAGPTLGSKFLFTVPQAQIRELALGDREGAITNEISMAITTPKGAADGADYSFGVYAATQ